MDRKKLESRNSALDIIRIVAVFTVLSVHFFLHNGFYYETVNGMGPIEGLLSFFGSGNADDLHGPAMFVMIQMRTIFGMCVPLFMILTGYLMSKKTLSRKYYGGIKKTLIVFVLASVFCMMFKSVHEVPAAKAAFYAGNLPGMFSAISSNGGYTFIKYIYSIFDFTGANYSWYIEMYIGLFLIAPFLNLGYNKLRSKRQKQVLVATFVFLTIIPTVFNIFNFNTATWWHNPTESDTYQKFIPSFWMGIYPIAYYYIGAYIREYGVKLRTRSLIAVFATGLFLIGAFSFYRSYGSTFQSSSYVYWYGFGPCFTSTCTFVLLSRIKTKGWKPGVKNALWFVSDLALGIYLMSFISDSLIYPILNEKVPVMIDRLPFYFVTVPLSFIFAALLSVIVNLLASLITDGCSKLWSFIKAQAARDDRQKWQHLLFAVLIAGGLLFTFWKINYGFGGNDEAFYLTIPHRLINGDALFTDEWHLSQLSSFLLIPFVWIFTAFTGSTEGIMMFARICYVLVHAGASVLIYYKLRKYGYLSVVASLLYFIFTPYDITALSYDTMGLELVTLTGVLLATADYSKKIQLIISGLTFAGAVLCCPYLAAVYPLYAICMAVHLLLKKRDIKFVLKSEMFAPKSFLFFTIGAAALGAVFLIFTLSRTSVGDILKNLPLMLTDPEHPQIPFITKLNDYFKSIFECHVHFKYSVYSYLLMLTCMLFDRKRRLHRSVYLTITAGIVIYSQLLFLPNLHYSTYNAIMFPMLFMGITSYILCENKPRELFAALFIFGILYSFCIHLASNQYFYIISMAVTASNVASCIFLAQLIKEMKENPDNITYAVWIKRLSFTAAALALIIQAGCQIGTKARHVFWDYEPSALTEQISEGPANGIYTTKDNKETYEKIYEDIMVNLPEGGNEKVLFLTNRTWTYLAADSYENAAFSAWLSGERESSLERLRSFYEVNPEKVPDIIYIPRDSEWEVGKILAEAQMDGYILSQNDVSYRLVK